MSTEQSSPTNLIGASIRRVEDPPLLTGQGCYVDDVKLPGILHVAIHRSTHPHARLLSIDTSEAAAMPGVECVLTGDDIGSLALQTPMVAPGMKMPDHPVLAQGAVHAVGAPIAAVVAESRAVAEDAAASIQVTYDPLPVVTDAEAALEDGAPLAHEELGTNHCYSMKREGGDVDKAFAEADHICRLHMKSPRVVAMSMEARGVLANPEPARNELTVWLSTQGPHRARSDLANSLGFPENRIRVIAPDVGGGFGSKGCLYREDVLVCHLAQKLGRPVKWMAHPQRGLSHHLPGTRPGHDLGAGPEQGRQDARPEGTRGGQPRRLPALGHGRTAPAHAGHGPRLLPDSGRAGGDRRGLYQHRAHRTVPRRRPARIGAQHRTAGRQGRPGTSAWTPWSFAARTSSSRTSSPTAPAWGWR